MINKEKNFISAVVYVHNAADRIEDFLKMIVETFEENFENSEIICVNDASADDSADKIREIGKTVASSSISLVNMSYFHGLETAMNAGVDLSIGDFVFEFDSTIPDFDKKCIMEVYRHSLEGFDIVSAVPDRKEKFTSAIFYKVFERFTDITYEMHTESFRILSRRVINRISSMNKTIPYRKAVYATQGLKTDAILYKPGDVGKIKRDKQEKRYRSGLATDTLILFTELGYRFSFTMTVFMMLMSAFMVIYSLVIFLTSNPVEGWTTTIMFLSVAFFGLFGILTIIIKYLQLIVNLVFKRKHYSFEGIEKLTK